MWSRRWTEGILRTSTRRSTRSRPIPPKSSSTGMAAESCSTFRRPRPVRARDAAAMEERRVTKKILVVEDDATTADYVAKGFEQNGYVVDVASDGRDGLFHATDGHYAAIVLDRMLPGMDGLA